MTRYGVSISLILAYSIFTTAKAGELPKFLSTKTVIVEGKGVHENETRAQELAIANAVQAAVEEVATSYFPTAQAEVRQILVDKILPNASDYVKTFEILPASFQRLGERTRLSLQVVVHVETLERDLWALGLARERWWRPRVMFILKEEIDQQRSDRHIFEAELQQAFGQDFIVMAPEMNFDLDERIRTFNQDVDVVARMQAGFRHDVDFLIIGEGVANYAGRRPIPPLPDSQYYYHAIVWAKAIRTDNGQAVALQSLDDVLAADIQSKAAIGALRRASRPLAESILEQMKRQWQREFIMDRRIEIRIHKIAPAQLFALESNILKIPGVFDVRSRYYEADTGLFDVAFRGPIRGLYDGLQNLAMRLERVDVDRLELTYGLDPGDTVGIGINAPPIEIDSLLIENLFPAQHFYYVRHPVGRVRIKNNTQRTYKSLRLSVHIPEVMNEPSDTTLAELRPSQTKDIAFTLPLAIAKLKELKADLTGQCKIKLSYFEAGKEKERKLNRPVRIYSPNAMDWQIAASIGAFIEPESPAVKNFTARIFDLAELPEDADAIQKARALWEGLRALKIRYRLDPYTAYRGQTIDYVKFPAQTLAERTGDCDDLSVLFVSCLENEGIPTALSVTPYHIFPMFGTGIPPEMWHQLSIPRDRLVFWQDQVWIPIEATYVAEDFDLALRVGKTVYDNWIEPEDSTNLSTREILKTYPSARLADQVLDFSDLPSIRFNDKLTKVGEIDPNRQAHLLALAGRFEEARRSYLELFHKDSTDAAVLNNLGNVNLMLGLADSALKCYDRAIAADPADTAIFFNLALALDLIALEEKNSIKKSLFESEADSVFDILVKSKKATAIVESMLGENPGVRAARPDEMKKRTGSNARIRKRLNEAKKRANKPKRKPKIAGTKNIQPLKNTIYLYWKFDGRDML